MASQDDQKVGPYSVVNFIRYAKTVDEVKEMVRVNNVDLTGDFNYVIRWASTVGLVGIVKYLLTVPEVNPGDCRNEAIIWASKNGHLEIVRLLLNDERVNPGDQKNAAIILASQNDHLDIFRLLLVDKRVYPTALHILPIIWLRRKEVGQVILTNETFRASLTPEDITFFTSD